MTRWRALRLALVVLALALLVLLLARLGPRHVAAQLGSVGVGATWLLVAYAAGTALGAFPWYVLLPERARPSIGATIAGRFAASGANAIVPLLGVGGEPVRLMWMPADRRATGIAGLIVDRLSYVVASGLFLALGAFAAFQLATMPASYAWIAVAGALALVALALLATWMAVRGRLATRVHTLVLRVRKRAHADGPTFGETIDRELDAILARRRRLLVAVALGLGARILLGAEIVVGFYLLDTELAPSHAIIFASVPVALAFVGAVVPSQLGIQEGSQALVAAALGISPATAVAVVLLQRVRSVVTAGFAWILIATRRPHPPRETAP